MAIIGDTHGFNQCQPPICPTDIIIDIIETECVSNNTLYVRWNIIDNTGGNLLDKLNTNTLTWSCDNQDLDNVVSPTNTTQPYETSFDVSGCPGVIYFQIKISVGTTFFKSSIESFSTSDCNSLGLTAVRASWCGDCPDTVGTPPSYMLYANSSSISSYPVYFSYGGLCWKILDNSSEMLIEDLPEGAILTDIDLTYSSCNNCCLQLDCPSPWVDPGGGDLVGTFYFEYQTYRIKDRLFVVKDFEATDCNSPIPPSEKILFDTGCVGTDNQVSPLFFVSDRKCLNKNATTYGFCIKVRQSELPIGIVIDCNCAETSGTYWRICVIDPSGETTSWEGGDECLCEEVNENKWYCAQSNSTLICSCTQTVDSDNQTVISEHLDQTDCAVNCTCEPPEFIKLRNTGGFGNGNGVWVDGNYIYFADGSSGLRAYTFNGSNFNNLDNIDNGGSARDIWGDGTYIYLANGFNNLRAYTFDGSDFTNVGYLPVGAGECLGIWGDGTYIYVAIGVLGLRAYTFDGSNFTNVGNIDNGGTAYGVWGDGTFIYLANGLDGLIAYTFDGSNFYNIDNINNTGTAFNVWGDGNYIYLANGNGGIVAYRFE